MENMSIRKCLFTKVDIFQRKVSNTDQLESVLINLRIKWPPCVCSQDTDSASATEYHCHFEYQRNLGVWRHPRWKCPGRMEVVLLQEAGLCGTANQQQWSASHHAAGKPYHQRSCWSGHRSLQVSGHLTRGQWQQGSNTHGHWWVEFQVLQLMYVEDEGKMWM